jgi:hypothetical protein
MSILTTIKRNLAIRFQYLIRKRAQKKYVQDIIKKYKLDDKAERERIIYQFETMQSSKRAFGRKKQQNIKDKISFMIYHGLIKIVE